MKVRVPKGACDTHMHFYDVNRPGAPGTFLPGHFTVKDYREMQKKLGLERVVVVQANGRILIMPTERAAAMKQVLDALPPEIRDIDA